MTLIIPISKGVKPMAEVSELLLIERLEELSQLRGRYDTVCATKQRVVDSILPEEIRNKLRLLDAEYQGRLQEIEERIALLESTIKSGVVKLGSTVKASMLQAVWSNGKTTWNTEALEGYALGGHNEVLNFKIVGDPYVSIKGVK